MSANRGDNAGQTGRTESAAGYVARKDGLRNFFNALSARLKKPVIVSQKASRKQISGDFDLSKPQALLEAISAQLGLIWYHDGQTVYIYDADMKLIMEALVQWAPREKDVLMLVEHVRGALARYICHKFAVGNELRAVVISPEIEETVRKGVRQTSAGSFLNLEPSVSEDLLDRIAVTLGQISLAHKDIVLLTAVDVRRFVKKLIETRFREVEVLSFGEITDSVTVNVIQTV